MAARLPVSHSASNTNWILGGFVRKFSEDPPFAFRDPFHGSGEQAHAEIASRHSAAAREQDFCTYHNTPLTADIQVY
jgi:hypothetical protein